MSAPWINKWIDYDSSVKTPVLMRGKKVYVIGIEIDGRYRNDRKVLKSQLISFWTHHNPEMKAEAIYKHDDPKLYGCQRFKLPVIWDSIKVNNVWTNGKSNAPEESTDRQLLECLARYRYLYKKDGADVKRQIYDLGPYEAFYIDSPAIIRRGDLFPSYHKWDLKLEPAGRKQAEEDITAIPVGISTLHLALKSDRKIYPNGKPSKKALGKRRRIE